MASIRRIWPQACGYSVCRALDVQSAAVNKDTAMGNFIEFAEVAGAVIAAFGLALGLEWVGLYGLTSMMPGRRVRASDAPNRNV